MQKPVLRIWDVYPGYRILIFFQPGSRISDPGFNSNKKEEGGKFVVLLFFIAINLKNVKIRFFFNRNRKKVSAKCH
jgi:hypothetical protein